MKKTAFIFITVGILLCLDSCNSMEDTTYNVANSKSSALVSDELLNPHEHQTKTGESILPSTQEQLTSNGLMARASSDTSALAFYYYNGETIYHSYIYDSQTIQDILKELNMVNAVEVKTWSLDEITLPIYGFQTGATDGAGLFAAWSNDHWISQDGTAYSFNFDFSKFENDYPWADKKELSSFIHFPCAKFLLQNENGWNNRFLTPATELKLPDGVTMKLESWGSDTVSANIANNGDVLDIWRTLQSSSATER